MVATDTPLKGGEAAPLHLLGEFSGITPSQRAGCTPNPLAAGATPGATPRDVDGTPRVYGAGNAQPLPPLPTPKLPNSPN